MIDSQDDGAPQLPSEPIHRITTPIARFLHVEAASGGVLLAATLVALVAANSANGAAWLAFWKTPLGLSFGGFDLTHSLQHWINDGLMTIFFFVIGLEVKRELAIGELRDPRRAVLPIAAAIGGMLIPAGLYLFLQAGEAGARGWGIPMATDIAFVVGCMAVLGRRVPHSLRVMVLSLAIADDIGAILVIAIGYTDSVNFAALGAAGAGIAGVALLQRLGVRSFGVYVGAGAAIWFAFHESGLHATLEGVILGLMTPSTAYLSNTRVGRFTEAATEVLRGGEFDLLPDRTERLRRFRMAAREVVSPLEFLENALHPWVSFVIMPIFALANAGVPIHASAFADPVAVAIVVGLVVGKPAGIVLFSFLAVRAGLARLPEGVSWTMILGGGCLAGIGFTMALFVAGLALEGEVLGTAKVGVLAASTISAVLGLAILVTRSAPPATDAERP